MSQCLLNITSAIRWLAQASILCQSAEDGGFVLARKTLNTADYLLSALAADGTEVGGEIFVATDWNVHVPSVIELENGNIVAVCRIREGYRKAKYKVFDPSDNLLASVTHPRALTITLHRVSTYGWTFAIDYWLMTISSPVLAAKRVFDYNGSPQADEFPL